MAAIAHNIPVKDKGFLLSMRVEYILTLDRSIPASMTPARIPNATFYFTYLKLVKGDEVPTNALFSSVHRCNLYRRNRLPSCLAYLTSCLYCPSILIDNTR